MDCSWDCCVLPFTFSFEAIIRKHVILSVLHISNPLLVPLTDRNDCTSRFTRWLKDFLGNKRNLRQSMDVHVSFKEAYGKLIHPYMKRQDGNENLATLHMVYDTLCMPGNEFLVQMLEDVQSRMQTINGLHSRVGNVKLAHLLPITTIMPIDLQNMVILGCLQSVHIDPTSHEEYEDMNRLHLILSRKVSHTFPLLALHYVAGDQSDSVLQGLIQCNQPKTLRSFIRSLNPQMKKYIKFVVLIYLRMCALHVRYQMFPIESVKCVYQAMKMGEFMKKCSMVVCAHCMELLTHWGLTKRPSSFGYFLDSERLEHRCYRDDSTMCVMLSIFNPRNHTILSIGHSDRLHTTLCQGRRSCFEMADSETLMCSKCTSLGPTMSVKDRHSDTCLDSYERKLCPTCSTLSEFDPSITVQLQVPEESVDVDLREMRERKEGRRRSFFMKSLHVEEEKMTYKKLIR